MPVISDKSATKLALTAGLICLLVYLRALTCDFVNFDDQESILENVAIQQLNGAFLVGAFTTSYYGFWMPLTWISYAVDFQLWGLSPFGYHLTNILLHATNASLVVLIAHMLLRNRLLEEEKSGYRYFATLLFAALFWGLHPLRVESVAWVTERKDVLNGLFSLGAILLYLQYAQRKDTGDRSFVVCFILSVLSFSLSLMAKPVSVVLPLMLLVIDWYPLARLQRGTYRSILIEKVPYFVFSGAMSIATIVSAVRLNVLVSTDKLSVGERFIVAGNALFEYGRLSLYPVGILPLHSLPYPLPSDYVFKSVAALLMACGCFLLWRRCRLVPTAGLLFFLPLLPVLGFLQNGAQAFAARYTYLPAVAVSIATAVACSSVYTKITDAGLRRVLSFLATLLLCVYVVMTFRLIGVWKDSGTLWSRVIEHQPLAEAYKSRAIFYVTTGSYADAVADFSEAIRLARGQEVVEIYNLFAGRAVAFGRMGRYNEAISDFSAAIALYPHPSYYYSRGITLGALGRNKEAARDLEKAGSDPGAIRWFSPKPGRAQI